MDRELKERLSKKYNKICDQIVRVVHDYSPTDKFKEGDSAEVKGLIEEAFRRETGRMLRMSNLSECPLADVEAAILLAEMELTKARINKWVGGVKK